MSQNFKSTRNSGFGEGALFVPVPDLTPNSGSSSGNTSCWTSVCDVDAFGVQYSEFIPKTTGTAPSNAIVSPQNGGSFALQVADGTTTGGNERGQYAVDLQMERTSPTQVASGEYSSVQGFGNTATNVYSDARGFQTTASGMAASASGFCNDSLTDLINANGTGSSASGYVLNSGVIVSGDGSLAAGYVDGGTVNSDNGSSASGYVLNSGVIVSDDGSLAAGYVDGGKVNSDNGSFATGYLVSSIGLVASNFGSFASGQVTGVGHISSDYGSLASGNNSGTGSIQSNLGSFAGGQVSGAGSISSNNGSLASGNISGTGLIQSNLGSFAGGQVTNSGSITASAGAIAFGTNDSTGNLVSENSSITVASLTGTSLVNNMGTACATIGVGTDNGQFSINAGQRGALMVGLAEVSEFMSVGVDASAIIGQDLQITANTGTDQAGSLLIGQHGTNAHIFTANNTAPAGYDLVGPSFQMAYGASPGRTASQSIGAIIGFTSENGPLFPPTCFMGVTGGVFFPGYPTMLLEWSDRQMTAWRELESENKASQETLDMLRVGRLVSMDTDGKLFSATFGDIVVGVSSHADSVHVGSIYNSNVLHWAHAHDSKGGAFGIRRFRMSNRSGIVSILNQNRAPLRLQSDSIQKALAPTDTMIDIECLLELIRQDGLTVLAASPVVADAVKMDETQIPLPTVVDTVEANETQIPLPTVVETVQVDETQNPSSSLSAPTTAEILADVRSRRMSRRKHQHASRATQAAAAAVAPLVRKLVRGQNPEFQSIVDKLLGPIRCHRVAVGNPDYDAHRPFIPRVNRPSWSPVFAQGAVPVRDDGSCVPGGRCNVGNENGIATNGTADRPGRWLVIKRLEAFAVLIYLTL